MSAIFENLEAGTTIKEIIEQFDVTREQINAVLEFAARSLDPNPAAFALSAPQWPLFDYHMERIVAAVNAATPGGDTEVEIPLTTSKRSLAMQLQSAAQHGP